MLPEKDQRPGGEPEALEVSLAGNAPTVPTPNDSGCRRVRCRRVLTADKSVRRGIGRRCLQLGGDA